MRLTAVLQVLLMLAGLCLLRACGPEVAWAQTPTPTPVCSPVYWSSDCSTTGSYAWDSDCWRCTSGNGSAVAGLRPRRPDISCVFDHFAAGSGQTVTVTGSAGMACRGLSAVDDAVTTWVGVLNLAPGTETLTLGAVGDTFSPGHAYRTCADHTNICHDDTDCAGVPGTPCGNGFATDPTGTWTLRLTEIAGLVTQAQTGDLHFRNVIFDPASTAWELRGFHAYGGATWTGAALDNDAAHDVRILVDGAVACDGVTLTSSTNFLIKMNVQNPMSCSAATMDHVDGESGIANSLPIFAVGGSVDAGNNTNVCFNGDCPAGTYTPLPTPTQTPTNTPPKNCYQVGDVSPGSCNVGQPTPAPYCLDDATCSGILGPGCESVIQSGGLCGGVPPSCTCVLVPDAVCNPESLFGAPCVTLTPTAGAATPTPALVRRHGFSGGAVVNVQ